MARVTHITDWEIETVNGAIASNTQIKTSCKKWVKIEGIDNDGPTCIICQQIKSDRLIDHAFDEEDQ